MHRCIKSVLFWNDTLHVSAGLSVHRQEFETAHTAKGTAVRLLAGPLASGQQYLFGVRLLLYVLSRTPDDGRKDHPKHVEYHSKIKQI